MKLSDALDVVETMPDECVIFAKKPWSLDSDAVTAALTTDFRVPPEIEKQGFVYFLEASLAKEVLSVFHDRRVSRSKRLALLVFYAENDAYPSWIYEDAD